MRLTRYILLLTAFIPMAVGCVREEMVQIDPDMVIVPVLHDPGFPQEPEAITITAANQSEEITFTWDAAHLGFGAQFNYSIELYVVDSLKAAIGGGVNATTTTVKYEDINYALVVTLGAVPAEPVKVNFCLSASVGVRKFYSEPVSALIVPTNASKQFPHVYFIGSYCDWKHDASQLLYDFTETDVKFHGMIDLGEKWESTAEGGFKLTPDANWNAEWGYPYEDGEYDNPEVDPDEIALVTSGGGDIVHYRSHRFYHFTMSKETGMLVKNAAFDNITLTYGGKDIPLSFHSVAHSQVFYADVTVAGGETFTVKTDDKAGVAFGADESDTEGLLVLAEGTPKDVTVTVEPGNYRLYVNLNNWDGLTYEFNPEKYGTEEGAGTVVTTVKGYGLCGYMNNWKGDHMLEFDGECWWVAYDVELKYDYDFIIRKDGSGATVFGGEFKVNKPTYLTHDGGDIIITAPTDFYDIYFNPANGCCWFISDGSVPESGATAPRPDGACDWTICGEFNEWGKGSVSDIWMFPEGKFYVAKGVTFKEGEQFKFRQFLRWEAGNKTFTNTPLTSDKYYPLYDGSANDGNITVAEAGKYDVYMSNDCAYVYLMTEGKTPDTAMPYLPEKPENAAPWSISGTFVGWNDWWMIEEGDYYVAKGVYLTATDKFKFRFQSDWGMSRGGSSVAEGGFWYAVTADGGDIHVGNAGVYDIYLAKTLDKFYFMTAGEDPTVAGNGAANMSEWAVSGTFNDWTCAWMKKEGHCYVLRNVVMDAGTGFKFRKGEDWSDNRTISQNVSPDMGYSVKSDGAEGAEIKVSAAGTYDLYLTSDLSTMYIMTAGTDPRTAGGVPFPDLVDVTIYSDAGYDYLYGWWTGTENHFTASWAGNLYGSIVKIDGVSYRKWELAVDKTNFETLKVHFILSGTSGQTGDSDAMTLAEEMFLTVKNGKVVIKDFNDPGTGNDPEDTQMVTIYADASYSHLYGWLVDDGDNYFLGAWPGTAGTGVSKTIGGVTYTRMWQLPASLAGETVRMILNDDNGSQTDDSCIIRLDDVVLISQKSQSVEGRDYIVWDNRPSDEEKATVTVYCNTDKDNLYGWFSDGSFATAAWPGTKADGTETKDGVSYMKWTLSVSKNRLEYDRVQFILNKDGSNQTDDGEMLVLSPETYLTIDANKPVLKK